MEFRCVLSSEPPAAPGVPLDIVMLLEIVPEAVLQRCIKIADEAPLQKSAGADILRRRSSNQQKIVRNRGVIDTTFRM